MMGAQQCRVFCKLFTKFFVNSKDARFQAKFQSSQKLGSVQLGKIYYSYFTSLCSGELNNNGMKGLTRQTSTNMMNGIGNNYFGGEPIEDVEPVYITMLQMFSF